MTRDREFLVRVPPGLADRLVETHLAAPLRAWRTRRGVFVHGRAAGAFARGAPGEAAFVPRADGIWVEGDGDAGSEPPAADLRAPVDPGDGVIIVEKSGAVWSTPRPESWPLLGSELDWGLAPWRGDLPDSLPGWNLSLVPSPRGSVRDGVVVREGEGERIARHLTELSARELRSLRRGGSAGIRWLYATRGLGDDFPAAGRALRNAGTPVEPVLVPVDRRPSPALALASIREAFGAREGDGILWWDPSDDGAEECIVFRRAGLEVLTPARVLEVPW